MPPKLPSIFHRRLVDVSIAKASKHFRSLSQILWNQRRIKSNTKFHMFKIVPLPCLLYDLQDAVLLEPHVLHLQVFVMRCLRILLGVSLREEL